MDFYKSVAVSGTIKTAAIFPAKTSANLSDGEKIASQIYDKITDRHSKNPQPTKSFLLSPVKTVDPKNTPSPGELIEQVLTPTGGRLDICDFDAIIDVGAVLRMFSSENVARYVVEKCNRKVAYSTAENVILVLSPDSSVVDYNKLSERAKKSLESLLFAVYDHSHTVGTNITLKKTAKGLVLVSPIIYTTSLMQAIMRLREFLGEDAQTIVFGISPELAQELNNRIKMKQSGNAPAENAGQRNDSLCENIWEYAMEEENKQINAEKLMMQTQRPNVEAGSSIRQGLAAQILFTKRAYPQDKQKNLMNLTELLFYKGHPSISVQ